jgi:anaerobic C4-dicarboxylate transporter
MTLWLQLAILLAALLIGAKIGGIGLGAMGGIGLFLLVFGFGLPAGSPPWTVLGMILAIVSALSLVEAAGASTWRCGSRKESCDGIPGG